LIFPFLLKFSNSRGTKFLVAIIIAATVLRVMLVVDGANPPVPWAERIMALNLLCIIAPG